MTGMVDLCREDVFGRWCPGGTPTRAQAEVLGFPYPLSGGWKKLLAGRLVSPATFERLLGLRMPPRKKAPPKNETPSLFDNDPERG